MSLRQHSCFNRVLGRDLSHTKPSSQTLGKADCIEERPDPKRREGMIAQARLKGVHWMLLAVCALAPTAALAQQDNASPSQNQQGQQQPQAAPPKTEAPQGPNEGAQAQAGEDQAKTQEDGKLIAVPGGKGLGISILGNQEAPKALVIVPWKSSELGNAIGISTVLDDSRQPIDKEVFMRMLSYYEIRSGTATAGNTQTKGNVAQPAIAAQGRKQ